MRNDYWLLVAMLAAFFVLLVVGDFVVPQVTHQHAPQLIQDATDQVRSIRLQVREEIEAVRNDRAMVSNMTVAVESMIAQVEAQNKALEEMVAISSNLVWQSRHPIAAERKE